MDRDAIKEATDILKSDNNLVQNWFAFFENLGHEDPNIVSLRQQFIMGTITSYELISTILNRWASFKGKSATVDELHNVLLNKCKNTSAAEEIRKHFNLEGNDQTEPISSQTIGRSSTMNLCDSVELQFKAHNKNNEVIIPFGIATFMGLSGTSINKLWTSLHEHLVRKLSVHQVRDLKSFSLSSEVIDEREYDGIKELTEELLRVIAKKDPEMIIKVLQFLNNEEGSLLAIRKNIHEAVEKLKQNK